MISPICSLYRKPNSISDFYRFKLNQNAFLPIWLQPNDALFRFRHSVGGRCGGQGWSAHHPKTIPTTRLFPEKQLGFYPKICECMKTALSLQFTYVDRFSPRFSSNSRARTSLANSWMDFLARSYSLTPGVSLGRARVSLTHWNSSLMFRHWLGWWCWLNLVGTEWYSCFSLVLAVSQLLHSVLCGSSV